MIQFRNPLLLAGLAAFVVPIILHLLSRARFRTVSWGAMMFLPGGDGRRQASRLRQWGLLATRCGMLGILAFALALPELRLGGKSGPMRAIIIFDRSASMDVVENDRSRLERAREAALNLLSHMAPGDSAVLIDATNPEQTSVSSDLQSIAEQILSMQLSKASANFAAALDRARESAQETAVPSHIFIISDRQANNWNGINGAFVRAWKTVPLPITWVPVGSRGMENIGIDSVRLLEPPAIVGLSCQFAVHVHNYGTSAQGPIHLKLSAGDRHLAEADVTLEGREDRAIVLPVRFSEPGEVDVSASIDAHDLASDNQRDVVVNVTGRLPVTIITGDVATGHFRRQADLLQLALAPFSTPTTSTVGDVRNPCIVQIASVDDWNAGIFAGQRVTILADAPALSADQVRMLEQFAYTGGNVIILPGSLIRADDFNQSLYRNGTGISPAALSPPTSSDAAPTAILGIDLSHPIFQFLKSSPDPIPQATIARYFPASPHGGDVRVLSSFATGDPFVVEGTFGHGRVLLITTPLDADWSNLPLSNFYLPFVQSCVRYLCAAGMAQHNVRPGQIITGHFPPRTDERSIRITLPDGRNDTCDVSLLGDRVEFRFGPVKEPGKYLVRASVPRGEQQQEFIVEPPASESDLTPLDTSQLQHLEMALGMRVLAANSPPSPELTRSGTEISLWLAGVILVLILSVGELFIAFASGRGRTA